MRKDAQMKKFIFLIGISGSGKSTLSKSYTNDEHIWLSSDDLRIQLYGSLEEGNKHNGELFQQMQQMALDYLKSTNGTVIYDATNLSRKQRAHMYRLVKTIDKTVVESVIMFRNPTTAKKWNNTRTGYAVVPEDIIEQQFMRLQIPRIGVDTDIITAEGEPWFTPTDEEIISLWDSRDVIKTLANMAIPEIAEILQLNYAPHDTPHHYESIDAHINMVANYTKSINPNLLLPAIFHDMGKGYVKGRGQNEGTLGRYLDHNLVSAQLLLNFMLFNTDSKTTTENIESVELVYQHMAAHQLNWNNTEKFQRKNNINTALLEDLKQFAQIDNKMRLH